ncbi:MAG: crotonase/enoyl-CoA hydratase family protein [Myxococcota bacterium]
MNDRVVLSLDGSVATVRLSRPEKLNGLDRAMFEAIVDAGKSISTNPSIRAVVLHGEGRAFCAGLDFPSFVGNPGAMEALLERETDTPANVAQRVAWIWQELPQPVIASIHGYAYGGGLQIALGADLRFAAPDAELSVMEIKWGIIPDMSITQTLLRLVPLDVAKELTFTGRKLSGQEAADLGLVTRVCEDPLSEALEMAHVIAEKNPHAIRAGKALYNRALGLPVPEALALETELQLPLLGSKNQVEAVSANMAKREPVFDDPTS